MVVKDNRKAILDESAGTAVSKSVKAGRKSTLVVVRSSTKSGASNRPGDGRGTAPLQSPRRQRLATTAPFLDSPDAPPRRLDSPTNPSPYCPRDRDRLRCASELIGEDETDYCKPFALSRPCLGACVP